MSLIMGEMDKTMKNGRLALIFADVQQEVPEYLCMDEGGGLYLCTVGQQDGDFAAKDAKSISSIEAFIFIANACNKARAFISDNGNMKEHMK